MTLPLATGLPIEKLRAGDSFGNGSYCGGGVITHGNSQNYTVRQDGYFFVGDNVTNSRDSRFFGFVPADFVIGIVPGR